MKHYYLLALSFILPLLVACSSKTEDIPTVDLQLLSTNPTNNATDVSADITEIVLTFNQDVKIMPRALNLATLNGSSAREIMSVDGAKVTVKLSGVTNNSTYTLYIPDNGIVSLTNTSDGCDEINLTFKTESLKLSVTPDVSPVSTGVETEAIAWTKKIVAGWNLGNSFESCGGTWDASSQSWTDVWMQDRNEWETAWGNPKTTEAMVAALKNAGFNAIRIPVRWEPHVTDLSTMTIDPQWIGRVKEVVDYAVSNDMYVIINTHHDLWMENRPLDRYAAEISTMETNLWKNIATYFRDYDEHLVFAATNEVNVNWAAPTEENYRVQNGFNQDFVSAVRSTGGRNWYRNLIVQTYSSNPDYGLAGFVTPADVVDNHLIVEFHYYMPYDYCSGSVYYWGSEYAKYGDISKNGDETTLKTLFEQLDKKFHTQGLGIVMGETGVSYHLDGKDNTHQLANMKYYLTTVYSTAKTYGIAPFVWDNNVFGSREESYGIFDRNNGMKVRTQEFLDGIMAGAKTAYPN